VEVARVTHGDRVTALAWSPDGRLLPTGSDDKAVRVVEAATGREIARVTHDDTVTALAWSPDGQVLASGSIDKTARIVEAATGKNIAAVAWSPDGRLLATGSGDKTARIFEAATGKEIAQVAHAGSVRVVSWSANGHLLVTGCDCNSARIIEAATGKEVARLAYDGGVNAVAWSREGTAVSPAIFTGSTDGTARLWRAFPTPESLVNAAKEHAGRCLTQEQRAQYSLPAAPPTWCVERRLWPYTSVKWQPWLLLQKAWLASDRKGEKPLLPKAE
jgi:WD40 repeat protein